MSHHSLDSPKGEHPTYLDHSADLQHAHALRVTKKSGIAGLFKDRRMSVLGSWIILNTSWR